MKYVTEEEQEVIDVKAQEITARITGGTLYGNEVTPGEHKALIVAAYWLGQGDAWLEAGKKIDELVER